LADAYAVSFGNLTQHPSTHIWTLGCKKLMQETEEVLPLLAICVSVTKIDA